MGDWGGDGCRYGVQGRSWQNSVRVGSGGNGTRMILGGVFAHYENMH